MDICGKLYVKSWWKKRGAKRRISLPQRDKCTRVQLPWDPAHYNPNYVHRNQGRAKSQGKGKGAMVDQILKEVFKKVVWK